MQKPLLIVVVGPTAVGKTEVCIALARHFGLEVLSADSRQFYREMRIGTAKPLPAELQGVPHHFFDFLSVADEYSVGQYERDAMAMLPAVFARRPMAVLSGGSGLFVRAVCEGIDDIPPLADGVREQVMREFAQAGLPPLLAELERRDPTYYKEVDRANHARVIRAIEVIRSSGRPFSQFRTRTAAERPFDILKIGLSREREALYARINERVDRMMEAGLLQEVRQLLPHKHLNALQTVGYQEFFPYFEGHISLEEAVELVKRNTRRYAKKQMTWFNREENMNWFCPDEMAKIIEFVEESALLRP